MSEGMVDQSKDAVRTEDASLPDANFLADLTSRPYPVEAANDNHRARPYIPFSPGWYVMCLGDNDLG